MRRDSNNNLLKCACVDQITKEQDIDVFCPLCWGEGNYFDEVFISVYRSQPMSILPQANSKTSTAPGIQKDEDIVFYTTYEEDITGEDIIIELFLDKEGGVIKPYKRKKRYKIGNVIDYRLDKSKLEFWQISCVENKLKWLNGK